MDISKCSATCLWVSKYSIKNNTTYDYSNIPRPIFSFAYVYSGWAEISYDRKVFRILPGDMIFIPYGSYYSSKWFGEPSCEYISLHFNFGFNSPFRTTAYNVQPLYKNEKYVKSMEYMFDNQDNPEKSLSVLENFYGICGDLLTQLENKSSLVIDERIKKAVDYIESNCGKNMTVEELAKLCYMSPSYFYSEFKRETGTSPIAYKNIFRINKSIQKLTESADMTIEAVSEICGFESVNYFRKLFKDVTGVSPREYRKRYKTGL